MAAIANLPSLPLPTGGLVLQEASISEENSCARQLRGGARGGTWAGSSSVNLIASCSSSSCSSSSSSSSSASIASSSLVVARFGGRRSTTGGRSKFYRGGQTGSFMIHRLVCACNGDRQRQGTVCYASDRGVENAGYQVGISGFLKPL